MNKFKFLSLALMIVIITSVLCARNTQARADQSKSIDLDEKDQITNTVQAKFYMRYRSFSKLEMESFEGLIDESSKGYSFKSSEFEKMEIELSHARYYHLRYLRYEYFLDFKDILIDSFDEVAILFVVEGHDVEFEISREVSKVEPIISKMRNLQHSIVLRKENGTWKIVSDTYEDYLWRLLKTTGLSKKDLIQPDEDFQNQLPGSDGTMGEYST